MRRLLAVAPVVALMVLLASLPALAFSCPALVGQARQTIAQAEAGVGALAGEAKTLALRYIESAKHYANLAETFHQQAGAQGARNLHYEAELYAHFARVFADMALRVQQIR